MAPNKMLTCKFFAQGSCRNGDSCNFIHGKATSSPRGHSDDFRAKVPCRFFAQGSCQNEEHCSFVHEKPADSPQSLSDSRTSVPCRFLLRPGGCQNGSCPYLHAVDGSKVDTGVDQDVEVSAEKDPEHDDDFIRNLSGASVYFDDFGRVIKVSFPSDFSLACITGLAPGTTRAAIVDMLRALDFNLDMNCVRISGSIGCSETKAMVKVEDPSFAKTLSIRLKDQKSTLVATPISIDTKGSNCRKVYISWHKASCAAWVNFGNGEIANRVASKFNENRYQCLGQCVRSSTGKKSSSRGRGRGRGHSSYNPVAWTIKLTDVPSNATSKDIERAIISRQDEPRHIELGTATYRATDAEVSAEVRSHLEKHGPLENFYLEPTIRGKRKKATAWFQDEADAKSACSLNNKPLGILGNGKLTVTSVQSIKIKISRAVYMATKFGIDQVSKVWEEQHLTLRVYQDTLYQYTTLKVEGNNTKDLADARRALEKLFDGVVIMDAEAAMWDTSLNSNGRAYMNLKSIEKKLQVVIVRDKAMRQLRFCGPPGKFQQVIQQITDMLREETSSNYQIDFKSFQEFSWAIHGGFKSIEQTLGNNVAVFNVVSRTITINGTRQQYETAIAIMDGRDAVAAHFLSDNPADVKGECPICLCEADSPVETSCKHTYCPECFEECCRSAASSSKDELQIECHGDRGTCSTVFTLREITDLVSSSVFEAVLKSSFEQFIQRRPQAFRYCPTPDCGYIYRCTTASSLKPLAYRCPNCLEPLCTSCHSRHGDYTCADYKEIASGGYEALAKLKRELNIKDCPRCTTPMEKTEGCNHMTCVACKAHICWVCMAVFDESGPCYEHMNMAHGGIGLGLERFMD